MNAHAERNVRLFYSEILPSQLIDAASYSKRTTTKTSAVNTRINPIPGLWATMAIIVTEKAAQAFPRIHCSLKAETVYLHLPYHFSTACPQGERTRAFIIQSIGQVYDALPAFPCPEVKLNYKIGPVLSWAAMQQWCLEVSVEICLGALGNVFNSTFCDHCPKIFDSVLQESLNTNSKQEAKQNHWIQIFCTNKQKKECRKYLVDSVRILRIITLR